MPHAVCNPQGVGDFILVTMHFEIEIIVVNLPSALSAFRTEGPALLLTRRQIYAGYPL